MIQDAPVYSAPRWALTRWLAESGQPLPDDVRARLNAMLFGNLPIFLGGAANTAASPSSWRSGSPRRSSSPGVPSRSPSPGAPRSDDPRP